MSGCVSHYFEARVPDISVEKFDGLTLHSRDYREPEMLKDRSVLVFGAGDSGTDIAIEIAPFAAKVTRFAPVIYTPYLHCAWFCEIVLKSNS